MHQRRVAASLALGGLVIVLLGSFVYFRVVNDAYAFQERARRLTGRPVAEAKNALGEPNKVVSSAQYLAHERASILASYKPEPPELDCESIWMYYEDFWLVLLFVTNERIIEVYCGEG